MKDSKITSISIASIVMIALTVIIMCSPTEPQAQENFTLDTKEIMAQSSEKDGTSKIDWNNYLKEAADKRGEQLDSLYQKALATELTDAEAIIDYIRSSGMEDEVIEKLVGEVKSQFVPPTWMWIVGAIVLLFAFFGMIQLFKVIETGFKPKPSHQSLARQNTHQESGYKKS